MVGAPGAEIGDENDIVVSVQFVAPTRRSSRGA
ncbi:MAG: hypothetical protein BWX79_03167 [Alphaproteobacteria bacterium ADurb.Bin100]|nr:MAG: hypothetical protein BWX79_03167 [Alphaproteobacteria bacterium ADurb.Bin100]